MDKKYELLKDDYIHYRWKILYRIRALKDFSDVKAGDVGGYIESEKNLNHEGYCWVYDNAKVYANAEVFGHSKVYGNAQVYGNAKVYDNAEVYGDVKVFGHSEIYGLAKVYHSVIVFGNAQVYGLAKVCGNAWIYGNSKVCGGAEVFGSASVYDDAYVYEGAIVGKVSMPYKNIFQYQCRHRMLTAILTKDDEVLYTLGCQHNITKEEFIDRILGDDGGLENNPHREEYLKLIPAIEIYFKGE